MSVEMKWWYSKILSILENIIELILNVVRLLGLSFGYF